MMLKPKRILSPNLHLLYDARHVLGSTIYDMSGQGNNGTLSGVTLEAGRLAPALKFGWGKDIDIGATKFDTFTEGTIMAWFKRSGTFITYDCIFGHYKDGNNFQGIYANPATQSLFAENWIGGSGDFAQATTVVNDGVWRHVAMTFGSGGLKCFINAVQEGQDLTSTYDFTDTAPSAAVKVGSQASAWYWLDALQDIRVYNTALSASDILKILNSIGV